MKFTQFALTLMTAMILVAPSVHAKSGATPNSTLSFDELPEVADVQKASKCSFVKDKTRKMKSNMPFVIQGNDKEKKTVCSGRITCDMIPNSMIFDTEGEISCGFPDANHKCEARECLIKYIQDRKLLEAKIHSIEDSQQRATSSTVEGEPPQ